MGKLIEILGIKEQSNLPQDVLVAEAVIIGLQEIYANSEDNNRKRKLADTIAELTRLLMQQLRQVAVVTETKEELIQIGRIYRNNYQGFYLESETTRYGNSTILGKKYEIIWNTDTGSGSAINFKQELNDAEFQTELNAHPEKIDLVEYNWYKGEYTLDGGEIIKFLYCFDEIKEITNEGYIRLKYSTLFWGGIFKNKLSGDTLILGNNQATIFSNLATEDDIKSFYIDYLKRRLPNLFDGDKIKYGDGIYIEDDNNGQIYITSKEDFFSLEVINGDVSFYLKNDITGEYMPLFFEDKWANIKMGGIMPNFEKGKWYYSEYKPTHSNETWKSFILFDRIVPITPQYSGLKPYNQVNYSDRFIDYGNGGYNYDRDKHFSNTEWEATYRLVNRSDESTLEKIVENYIRTNGKYKVGTKIDNTNIGEPYNNIELMSPIIFATFLSTHYNELRAYYNGYTIYDSTQNERWAKIVNTQPSPQIQTQRAGRRKSKPQPDTDPTSVTEGTIEVGNDGNRYVARKGGDGNNRWSKVK